jgi:hypothetical protein
MGKKRIPRRKTRTKKTARKTRIKRAAYPPRPRPPPPQPPKPPPPPPAAKSTTETHALAAADDLLWFDKLPSDVRNAINAACWKISSRAIYEFWLGGMTVHEILANLDKFNREHGGVVRP